MPDYDVEGGVKLPTPKRTMFLVTATGRMYTVDFSEKPQLNDPGLIDWNLSVAKMLLGKFQLTRTRAVTLEEIEIENTVRTDQFPAGSALDLEVVVYTSLDGRTPENPIHPVVTHESDGLVHLKTRTTGQNFSMQLRGVYSVNTIIFTTHQNGRR